MERPDPEPRAPGTSFVPQAVPTPSTPACLFLDVDGTVIDFAATPDEVHVDEQLIELLTDVRHAVQGALALVSGRSIAVLDRLFEPLRLPAAGVHGFERRDVNGGLHHRALLDEPLMAARTALERFVASHEGLLLEDKGSALAVHYRRAPHFGELVRIIVGGLPIAKAPEFELLDGDAVLEIKPASSNKATAIEAFMQEAPYAGRLPIFIGDDLTDCDGFAAVRRHAGVTIAVGNRVSAQWQLQGPPAVRAWLRNFATAQGRMR